MMKTMHILERVAAAILVGFAATGARADGVTNGGQVYPLGIYNSTIPSLAAGQTNVLQLDANGNLKTSGGSGGPVTEANGANAALGSTTDAPLTAAASTSAATLLAVIKGLYNLFQSGNAKFQVETWWQETTTSQAIAANASFGGTTRSSGSTAGSAGPFGYFQATVLSTQAGTAYLVNTTTNQSVQISSVAANTPISLKAPAFSSTFNVAFVNGPTAGAITISDGFTTN